MNAVVSRLAPDELSELREHIERRTGELAAPIAASGEIRLPNPMGSPRDVNT